MTVQKKSALIFPAFAHDYPTDPFTGVKDLEQLFHFFLRQASDAVDNSLITFNPVSNDFLGDELRTQYVAYIISCSLSDYFKKREITFSFTAGYSMGIYASLFHSGVISFTEGLLLIRSAYHAIKQITGDEKYGMCSIIGLSRKDISELILDSGLAGSITNQNSEYALVISGKLKDIILLTDLAKKEGALYTNLLKVNLPYHSDLLSGTQEDFRQFIQTIHFGNPGIKIISLVDQRIMYDPDDLRNELINNIFTPLSWYKTQVELQNFGVKIFIEGGFGTGLVKNAKFIEGSFKFHSGLEYIKRDE